MNPPTDTEHEPQGEGPRVTRDEVRDLARIRRSRDDRKVAGVAAGVARHLDIDPLLVRIAFVVLTFFGGGGLILYGVCWLLVPEEGTEDTVIRVDEGIRTAALIVGGIITVASVVGDTVGGPDFPWPLLLAGLVLIVVLGGKQAMKPGGPTHPWLRGGPPPEPASEPGEPGRPGAAYTGYRPGPPPPPRRPRDPRRRGPLLFPFTVGLAALGLGLLGTLQLAGVDITPSAYPATVLGVTGLMLLVGAFYGRAGGLILIGLIAALATAATSVVDEFDKTGFGQISPTITSAGDVAGPYELAAGEIVIDLTDLDETELRKLDGRILEADLNVGHIRVIVPDDGLRVAADASIELGEVVLFGDKSGNAARATHGEQDEPYLRIDAKAVLGQVEVITEKDAA
ncbi:PspC domain-containing protein [Nocardioides carbamazepini]|uniref:PspC domain-containing protein n=1 Tax=Nocardioides carbamazepini TaxID=2854259 RepID=UPI00214A75C4|nr:PspC domain-containing protein [Nocardioides carbamazepini]MCR1784347.1 PspC domain-containing protein [Nocardioides carbamazepini]